MTRPRPNFVVVDLEATCWQGTAPAPSEIIEIGAVLVQGDADPATEFQSYVRPREAPHLSDFCRELTHIRQEDVDTAPPFPGAFAAFAAWRAHLPPHRLASWGDYDRKQLLRDCALHGIEFAIADHINIKATFARLKRVRPCGMSIALRLAGLPMEGTHHRGIDDARNIAHLLQFLTREFPDDDAWNPAN